MTPDDMEPMRFPIPDLGHRSSGDDLPLRDGYPNPSLSEP